MLGIAIFCASMVVVDGDTTVCRDSNGMMHEIRVEALHAPEADDPGGEVATEALAEVLGSGWFWVCRGSAYSFRRIVATCRDDQGRDLAEAMIRSGTADHCPRFGRTELAALPSNGLDLPDYCEPRPRRRP